MAAGTSLREKGDYWEAIGFLSEAVEVRMYAQMHATLSARLGGVVFRLWRDLCAHTYIGLSMGLQSQRNESGLLREDGNVPVGH